MDVGSALNLKQRRKEPPNSQGSISESVYLQSFPKEKFPSSNEIKQNVTLFLALVTFRVLNAFFIRTYDNPDEYWQSLEVASYLVFGQGYLTWEWHEQIRSFVHPLIFAMVYLVLDRVGLRSTEFFFLAPRLLQAVFAATGDYFTCLLAQKLAGSDITPYIIFTTLFSWFNWQNSVRTLSNSMETVLTVLALFYWPFVPDSDKFIGDLRKSLIWAAVACIIRPTNAVLWAFLGINLCLAQPRQFRVIIVNVSIILILALIFTTFIDTYLYTGTIPHMVSSLVFTPYTFFSLNVLHSISIFYGMHPWHWYLSQGLPFVMTTFLPFTVLGIRASFALDNSNIHRLRVRSLLNLCAWVVTIYSLLSHKEFRFIYPLVPSLLIFTAIGLRTLPRRFIIPIIVFLSITQLPFGFYVSFYHQRGVIDVIKWIRQEAPSGSFIAFLMPCHSTPWESEVGRGPEVRMWFLTCEPPLDSTNPNYQDEADIFYNDPPSFLIHNLIRPTTVHSRLYWPSHIVMFEALLPRLEGSEVWKTAQAEGYMECARFFNSHWHDDARRRGNVIVYCRNNSKNHNAESSM